MNEQPKWLLLGIGKVVLKKFKKIQMIAVQVQQILLWDKHGHV